MPACPVGEAAPANRVPRPANARPSDTIATGPTRRRPRRSVIGPTRRACGAPLQQGGRCSRGSARIRGVLRRPRSPIGKMWDTIPVALFYTSDRFTRNQTRHRQDTGKPPRTTTGRNMDNRTQANATDRAPPNRGLPLSAPVLAARRGVPRSPTAGRRQCTRHGRPPAGGAAWRGRPPAAAESGAADARGRGGRSGRGW